MYVVNLCHTQINSKILTVPIYLLKRILSADDFQDFRHINIKSESVKGIEYELKFNLDVICTKVYKQGCE
jgi:hypothetical protein